MNSFTSKGHSKNELYSISVVVWGFLRQVNDFLWDLNFFRILPYTSSTVDLLRERLLFNWICRLLNLIVLILFCGLLFKRVLSHHFIYCFLRNICGNTCWSSTIILVSAIIIIWYNWYDSRILKHLNLSVSRIFLRHHIKETRIFL